jgi:hypothetical protein
MSQDVRHPGLEHSHIVILLYAGAGGASARIVKLSEWGELIMSMYSHWRRRLRLWRDQVCLTGQADETCIAAFSAFSAFWFFGLSSDGGKLPSIQQL